MSSIKEKLNKIKAAKEDIKEALFEKGQEVGDAIAEYGDAIRNIRGDSSAKLLPLSNKLVRFLDYDGSVIFQKEYNEDEIIEYPSAPTHQGLIFQCWNRDDIVKGEYAIDFGATYTSVDGYTHLFIDLGNEPIDIDFEFQASNNEKLFVEWGDGQRTFCQNSHRYENESGIKEIIIWGDFNYIYFNFYNPSLSLLKKVILGNNITTIDTYGFQNCNALASIIINNNIRYIGSNAFENCYSLKSIIIPKYTTISGQRLFKNCFSLNSVIFPQISNAYVDEEMFENCYSLTSIVLPYGFNSINKRAFYACSSLTSIFLPNSLFKIMDNAFYKCTSLTSITIPINVSNIEEYAFESCNNLVSVSIPNSITSVRENVFTSKISKVIYNTTIDLGNIFLWKSSVGRLYLQSSNPLYTDDNFLNNYIGWLLYIDNEYIGIIEPKFTEYYYTDNKLYPSYVSGNSVYFDIPTKKFNGNIPHKINTSLGVSYGFDSNFSENSNMLLRVSFYDITDVSNITWIEPVF